MSDFYQLNADQQAEKLTVLARQALRHWNVEQCDPGLIKYRENAVFRVTDNTGTPAALRVHRQGYHSDASLASELRWMSMLRESGMHVPAPIPVTQNDASSEYMISIGNDELPGTWQVDMLSWMDGKELGEVGEPLRLGVHNPATVFENIGATMATLHNLSCNWSGTGSMQRHAWDHDGLVGDNPLWGQFWQLEALDQQQRKKILEIKHAVSEGLKAYGQSDENYGLIHADMVPENVMINGDHIQLIDFDDAGFGWHMFEIATALHWLGDEPEFDTMKSSLLQGYQRVRPLSNDDLNTLPLFHVARSLTYLGWVHTRSHTTTATEMTPIMIEIALSLGEDYLSSHQAR